MGKTRIVNLRKKGLFYAKIAYFRTVWGGSRPLSDTGIVLSPLGFGCAGAWGKSFAGKEMISDEEAQVLMERAYECGCTYFDTGFNYGFAEERIGRILKSSSILKRENIIISTKFGEKLVDGKWEMDWSPEWLNESVKISMSRMKIDYIDMLMCHGGEVSDFSEELFVALENLKKEGVVRAIGINTFDTDVIEWVRDNHKFDFVMLDYNIMRRDREPLIESLYKNGVGVIVGAPLAQSLYSNRVFKIKQLKDVWYFARAVVNFRIQILKGIRYRFINRVPEMSGTQVALRYVLDNPYVSSAVFGTTSINHLEENMETLTMKIPDSIVDKIKLVK